MTGRSVSDGAIDFNLDPTLGFERADAMSAEAARVRSAGEAQIAYADKLDQLAESYKEFLALQGARPSAQTPTTVTMPATEDHGATIMERVKLIFDAEPDRGWRAKDVADEVIGQGATRSQLETVRKCIYRLLDRGYLRTESRGLFVRGAS